MDMAARCNELAECDNNEDELECHMLEDYPTFTQIDLFLHMELLRILDIDDSNGDLSATFKINLAWTGHTVRYRNLARDSMVNQLYTAEMNSTWTPQIVLQDLYSRRREIHVPESLKIKIIDDTEFVNDVVNNNFFYEGNNVELHWSTVQR